MHPNNDDDPRLAPPSSAFLPTHPTSPPSLIPPPHATPAPQARLEFLYEWAVEGPPVAMPLGMLARPRSYLTAVQQVFAEQMGRPVGHISFDALLLQNDEDQVRPSGGRVLTGCFCVWGRGGGGWGGKAVHIRLEKAGGVLQ